MYFRSRAVFLVLSLAFTVSSILQPYGAVLAAPVERVVILFDRSSSMNALLDGVTKIDMGRTLFAQLATEFDGNENVAVRFFAGGQAETREENCKASTLALPFGARSQNSFAVLKDELTAKGKKTPLTHAIALATKDLGDWIGERRIIIISDGMDTCGEDPVPLAEELGAGGMIMNVVGLGTAADLAGLAELGLSSGANFSMASNYGEFAGAMGGLLPNMPPMPPMPMGFPAGGAGGSNASGMDAAAEAPAGSGAGAGRGGGPGGGTPASMPLVPLPPDQPIKVELRLKPDVVAPEPVAVEIILDVSGSMAAWLKGSSKMSQALSALEKSVGSLEAPHIQVGLRAYGFDATVEKTPEASCPNTELVVPFEALQTSLVLKKAKALTPYGYTPIAASLAAAGLDLTPFEKQTRQIILITDGEETCDGDPIAALRAIAGMCVDVNAHIVGFDLDPKARAEMQAIAAAGCGLYLDAPNGVELEKAMLEIVTEVAAKTQVDWDRYVNPITGGATLDEAVEIRDGAYTFEHHMDKGEKQYFRVPLTKAQRLRMVVTAQGRLVRFDGDGELVERPGYDFTSFWGDFLTAQGDKIPGPRGRLTFRSADPGYQEEVQLLDMAGDGIHLLVHANSMKINKDTRMDLLIDEAGDLMPGYDAPDAAGEGMEMVRYGQNAVGHMGLQDRIDTFAVPALSAGSDILSIRFNATNPDFKYRLVVARADTGRAIKRFNGLTGTQTLTVDVPDDIEALSFQIVSQVPGNKVFTSYTFVLEE